MTAEDSNEAPVEYEPISISNEFAEVSVRKVRTAKGERLEISVPYADYAIRLDAVNLESLAWQEPELFSELLEDPHGPDH